MMARLAIAVLHVSPMARSSQVGKAGGIENPKAGSFVSFPIASVIGCCVPFPP